MLEGIHDCSFKTERNTKKLLVTSALVSGLMNVHDVKNKTQGF